MIVRSYLVLVRLLTRDSRSHVVRLLTRDSHLAGAAGGSVARNELLDVDHGAVRLQLEPRRGGRAVRA